MRPFDHDYAEEILARIERVSADATPAWGTMTRDRLITHIADVREMFPVQIQVTKRGGISRLTNVS